MFAVVSALSASHLTVLAADPPADRKPNVLVIVADDLGYADVGFHGGKEIPTPHLDALAKAGTRFTSGYVSCPVCSPTRAGLVTGRYQQRFGHEFNPGGGGVRQDFGLPLTESTIASALKKVGYATGIVGKWHLGSTPQFHPLERGYDEYFGFLGGAHPYFANRPAPNGGQQQPILRGRETVDEPEYLTDAFGREAVAFIDRHHDHPFFLQLTFNAVHNPLQAPDKYLDRFKSIPDEKHQKYAAMLSALDDNVGRVLAALQKHNLDEQTLVFFVSDNGGPEATTSSNVPLSGRKGSVWEGGIRIPFVLRWTGRVPAGAVYDQPVITLDVSATAAAVAQAQLGAGKPIDGVNLLPYVTGQSKDAPHEQLYWRFGPQWAIRQGDYKLVKFGDDAPQLFDLAKDIGEKTDLAKEQAEVASQLAKTYSEWNAQLEEPRWRPAGPGKKQLERRKRRKAAAQ